MSTQPGHAQQSADFTPNLIQPAGYLCYVNGIRIPIVSASVSQGVGDIPSANIQLFPSKHLQRLGANDTVEVQLFYLDVFYAETPEYRILFDGYITGWSYQSTPHGRAISFNVTMDIAKYHQARMDFLTSTEGVTESLASAGVQSNTVPTAGLFHSYALLKRGLQYPENEQATGKPPEVTITRPFEYLWNTAMALCSTYVPPTVLSIPVVNYFARWARRRNFVNRLVGFPFFDDVDQTKADGVFPIIKAVQSQEILGQIGAAISAEVGQAGSMMDILQRMLSSVYCELVMLPTAPAVRTDLEGMILGGPEAEPRTTQEGRTAPLRLANYFIKPQTLFGTVPTCNLLFPSQIESISYQEDYNTQPTRVYAYDGFGLTAVPNAGSNPIARETMAVAYPAEARAAMEARAGMQGDPNSATTKSAITTGKNILVWPEEFFIGPVPSIVQAPYVFGLLQVIQQEAAGKAAENQVVEADSTKAADDQRERLLRMANLYAQYEYYRQRYANRGGAADLTFNPYVVPGFPCAIFDHRGSGYDQVGYVVNVMHTLAKGRMSTAINYSHGRTFQEFSRDVKDDSLEYVRRLSSAPREVVDSVRQTFQDPAKAQQVYQRMFYPGVAAVAAYSPLDLVQYKDGTVPDPRGTLESDIPLVTAGPAPATAGVPSIDVSSIQPELEVEPREEFRSVFTSQDQAMRFTSRPVCTLQEYIKFIHGEKESAEVQGLRQTRVKADKVAVYYDQIFERTKHTGIVPPAATGVSVRYDPPVITPKVTLNTGPAQAAPVSYKATIEDWSGALKKYRDEIENSQTLIE